MPCCTMCAGIAVLAALTLRTNSGCTGLAIMHLNVCQFTALGIIDRMLPNHMTAVLQVYS